MSIPWMVLAFSAGARSQSCEPAAASVISVQGDVDVSDSDRAHWRDVQLNQVLCAGQQVRLMAKSRAVLQLPNETLIHLDEGSVFTLRAIEPDKPAWLDLLRGALHIISRVPRALNIRTPLVNAGIEGTEFALQVQKEEAALWVYEGRVRFSNTLGQLLIASGEAAVAERGRGPERRIVVKPRRAVEWALYYPPLLDTRPERYPEALRAALAAYRQNDLPTAFARLEALPPEHRRGRFFTLRAGLLLSVGRVAEAERDIAAALKGNPKEGTALALRAAIAVVRNETEEALRLAQEAVAAEPRSPTPYVARSYAEQSAFEIEKAHQSLKQASQLAPEDALVWARLAEIELSLGDLDAALEAARKAEQLDPGLSRTQSVLGFAYLTRIEVDHAKTAFERALALDPADPLPRLGLGLARIRDGDIDSGTKEIETAASLDPNNSLIRSYLGKAYFEQKRGGLASTEFEQAKLLDPKDPTPWFYSGIHKQTTNRPVEALHDIEAAIARNDNRAVYRSKLSLDEDRAIRGTSLARVYDDLEFDRRALIEATKSLSLDPVDHSAHRFLSDTYARLPRHEIARVSELLQAQLLQPINITPVQPQLNETNLNIVRGLGPGEGAFNEYTPLFENTRPQLIVSGIAGNNDTIADETVLSGIYGRASYSLGQFHYDTDGFRKNNDQEHNVYDVFGQVALSPKLNLQAEYRYRDTQHGDIDLDFDPDRFSTRDQRGLQQRTGRIGLHFAYSPRVDLLGSMIYSEREEDRAIFDPLVNTKAAANDRGYQVEGQAIFREKHSNLTAGFGAYNIDVSERQAFDFITPIPEVPCTLSICEVSSEFERERDNAYFYANLGYLRNMNWTVGLSYDLYEEGEFERDKLNPKFGLQWDLTDNLRLRMAAFQVVKPALVVEQTIEPTQIAGFNQFFDDRNGTRAERYGLGLDARITPDLYLGTEASHRDLEVPIFDPETNIATSIEDHEENLFRGYLYWAFFDRWALSGEVEYEHFKRGPSDDLESPLRTVTFIAPLALRYFSPSGFFGEFGISYVEQTVDRDRSATLPAGDDQFLVLDALVGYRFPKRWGMISFEVNNLLDEEFNFQDTNFQTSEPRNPRYTPDTALLARLTLFFN